MKEKVVKNKEGIFGWTIIILPFKKALCNFLIAFPAAEKYINSIVFNFNINFIIIKPFSSFIITFPHLIFWFSSSVILTSITSPTLSKSFP
jgi:hypothetical protein